jgi:hypothetical protein
MIDVIHERFFYHSFPRRGASTDAEIEKGCKSLAAIRDFGLLLTPQFIEWNQPKLGGAPPRVLSVLQKRVCFTELSPGELSGHAEKFGRFALEFEIDTVRRLGAMPVFYVPQPTSESGDGSLVGTALVATGFAGDPDRRRRFMINRSIRCSPHDTPSARRSCHTRLAP